MRILVACEESQAVCIELRRLGHEAYSCDLMECSGGHPEWHIVGDVLPLLNGRCEFTTMDSIPHKIDDRWDAVIAFPPCTHLTSSGAPWFAKKRVDGRQREGVEFFCKVMSADTDILIVENPVGIMSGDYVVKWYPDIAWEYGLPYKPVQKIQPYWFGHNARKTTCLFGHGFKPLEATEIVDPGEMTADGHSYGASAAYARDENGKILAWNDPRTAVIRSKTPPGVARAIAEQIFGDARKEEHHEPED